MPFMLDGAAFGFEEGCASGTADLGNLVIGPTPPSIHDTKIARGGTSFVLLHLARLVGDEAQQRDVCNIDRAVVVQAPSNPGISMPGWPRLLPNFSTLRDDIGNIGEAAACSRRVFGLLNTRFTVYVFHLAGCRMRARQFSPSWERSW